MLHVTIDNYRIPETHNMGALFQNELSCWNTKIKPKHFVWWHKSAPDSLKSQEVSQDFL